MVKINWTTQAEEDLQSIFEYIKRDSEYYAIMQIEKIIEATDILILFPLSGKIVAESKNENIREIIKGNYRIIYRIFSETEIDILTIHHGARQFKM